MPDIAHQYRTIVSAAGVRKKAERGRLRITGADRVTFLQALVTNELMLLKTHQGAYAAYLTPQGRMVTDLHVFIRPDEVIADVPASLTADLAAKLDALVFAEDVQIADVSRVLVQVSVTGRRAAHLIANATGADEAALKELPVWSQIDIADGFVARTDDADIDSYDLVVSASREAEAIAELEAAGAVAMSAELAEAMRIQAGRPAFGTDMTAETIPLEAGLLERAISTSKGCYVGQEIVIRVLHRGAGRVAKRLVKLSLPTAPATGASIPAAGSALVVDGKTVGIVTSVSPALDASGMRALGYVHRDAAEAGRLLSVGDGAGLTATILGMAG